MGMYLVSSVMFTCMEPCHPNVSSQLIVSNEQQLFYPTYNIRKNLWDVFHVILKTGILSILIICHLDGVRNGAIS